VPQIFLTCYTYIDYHNFRYLLENNAGTSFADLKAGLEFLKSRRSSSRYVLFSDYTIAACVTSSILRLDYSIILLRMIKNCVFTT